ncbi:MAG: hypothetical protein ABIH08_06980 [Candidatus Omnitrophota bacterium]
MKKKLNFLLLIVIISLSLQGCSVFMAMHGKRDGNISAIQMGQDRAIVIANLGEPEKTVTTEDKRVDVFRLQRGNAPNGGRALAHGALDLLTFGFWEVIGTPIEAMQGESFTLTIEYNKNDKVEKVFTGETTTGTM